MGKATQDLRTEHDAILHVLDIADAVVSSAARGAGRLRFGKELVYFLRIFADKCHHGKEEGILFKELENQGPPTIRGPIGVMLQEHAEGRQHILLMDKAVAATDLGGWETHVRNYSGLLRSHIRKENGILFVLADGILDEAAQDELFERFEQHEEKVIGHGVHEELHAMIDAWSREFGLG